MAQVCAMLAALSDTMNRMENNIMQTMDANTQAFVNDARALRGEMRQVGQCLQADKREPPHAASNELKGSASAGEDRVIRETCRVTEKVTETVTRTLKGEETTCTKETRRQVTELEITREVVERLHGVEEKGDAHTHTHTSR